MHHKVMGSPRKALKKVKPKLYGHRIISIYIDQCT